MARERGKQRLIVGMLRVMAHNNHHILRARMCRLPETFANQALDPIAFVRTGNLAFGHYQAQAGMGHRNATPQNGEIAIATFAFRGVENGVELAGLREP